MDDKIKDFDELIKAYIGDSKEIIQKNITNLTAPGENYWSDMLKIDIVLRNKENGTNEPLKIVAKCCTNDVPMEGMNHRMFKTEIAFYKEVVPTMQKFVKDRGAPEMAFFSELVAARVNLSDQGEPDENAVLILKNLLSTGYVNIDRHVGFDFDAAKVILNDLAVFHAVGLAIKVLEPEIFETKIKKHVMFFDTPKMGEGEPPKKPPPFSLDIVRNTLLRNIFCRSNIEKFDELAKIAIEKFEKNELFTVDSDGVFSTMTHNDMWVNNTMQVIKDGKVLKNKFVDFQMYAIDNPANDLLFFLFTSVDIATLKNHFDYLITLYHQKLIQTLEAVGCDTKPFAYKYFLQKLKSAAIDKFITICFMTLAVIFKDKGEKADFREEKELKYSDLHTVAKEKVCLMFTEMVKRNWFL